FQNLVYEQADNLQGVAKTLNLKLERTDWLTRPQPQQLARNNAKFTQAVFAPEAIQTKRNTEAVEIAPNTLMAARAVDHKAAAPRGDECLRGGAEEEGGRQDQPGEPGEKTATARASGCRARVAARLMSRNSWRCSPPFP